MNKTERFLIADQICQIYLFETSPLEINVSSTLKKNLSKQLSNSKLNGEIDEFIFDEITKNVTETILVDSFPRFERSEINFELQNYLSKKIEEQKK